MMSETEIPKRQGPSEPKKEKRIHGEKMRAVCKIEKNTQK